MDAGFATQQQLTVGSTVTVAGKPFDVAGIVNQPPGATPASVSIPLAQAHALARMADDVGRWPAIMVLAAAFALGRH